MSKPAIKSVAAIAWLMGHIPTYLVTDPYGMFRGYTVTHWQAEVFHELEPAEVVWIWCPEDGVPVQTTADMVP